MSANPFRDAHDRAVAQQRFLSLFFRSERESFRYAAELAPDPEKAKAKLKLLYVSCGNKDGLIRISQGVHTYLKEKNVPHLWHVDEHAHDFQHWKKALYNFSQLIFKPVAK